MPLSTRRQAFSLIEVMAVAALIAILASITLPGVSEMIVRNRTSAEDAALKNLVQSIKESFESTDLSATNLAVFDSALTTGYGYVDTGKDANVEVWGHDATTGLYTKRDYTYSQYPAGTTLTTFSSGSGPNLGDSASSADWFVKIARLRGVTVDTSSGVVGVTVDTSSGVVVDRANNPELAKIAFNASDRPRLLVLCPPNYGEAARYLLISLMADSSQLTLPPMPSTQTALRGWFNTIWDFNFDAPNALPPTQWSNPAIMGSSGPDWITNELPKWTRTSSQYNYKVTLARLRVERISLPRFTLTVSNTSGDIGSVYFNFSGSNVAASTPVVLDARGSYPFQINPLTPDAVEIRGVLTGRRIVIQRGPTTGFENEVLRFTLRQNSDVAIQ